MLDYERLAMLYVQLGDAAADAVINRAMEELAVRLEHAERVYRHGQLSDLHKCTDAMVIISDQIGLCTLSLVAEAVGQCIDNADANALGATLHRLIRTGANSLTEIWEQQGVSI